MNQRITLSLTALALLAGPVLPLAHAAFEFGDSELYLLFDVTAEYTDNLFQTESLEEEVFIWTFEPGIEFDLSPYESVMDLVFVFQPRLRYYSEDTFDSPSGGTFEADLDDEQIYTFIDFNYDVDTFNIGAFASWDQVSAPSRELAGPILLESDNLDLGLDGAFELTSKFGIGGSVNYRDVSYEDESRNNGFVQDNSRFGIAGEVFYAMTPVIDLTAGIRYRSHEYEESVLGGDELEFDTTFLSVGVRGELTPGLIAAFAVGYEILDVETEGVDADDGFAMEGSFEWMPTEKLLATLTLLRESTGTALGSISTETAAEIDVLYSFSPMFDIFGGLELSSTEYENSTNREDDYFEVLFGAGYEPLEYLNLNASIAYRDNDSSLIGTSFSALSFILAAEVRY